MARAFFTLDVFTTESLTGNPLAVVLDSGGLSSEDMQRIAAEFNLSETVFVLPDSHDPARTKIRIFTPVHELPFAGHPTVGTAVLLSQLNNVEDGSLLVLEEKVGPVTCQVFSQNGVRSARFELPKIPKQRPWNFVKQEIAQALGIQADDIGFDDHQPAIWDGGLNYALVPVVSIETMRALNVDPQKLNAIEVDFGDHSANIYAYCRGGNSDDASFHARMFAPGAGIPEDPATGSAVASFCGQIGELEMKPDGTGSFLIEQGYEMGRPSQIHLDMIKRGGAVDSAFISGNAVIVAEGKLHV